MSALPYIRLYVADYMADTAHLSALEHGAYLLMIMTYWQRGKALPNSDAHLSKICRLTLRKWQGIKANILPYFQERGGLLHHSRIENELRKVNSKSFNLAKAGRASARAKALKRKKQTSTNVATNVEQMSIYTDTDTERKITTQQRVREDWAQLETTLRRAARWENHSAPNLAVVGPIVSLLEAGCILELDVLPTIAARAPRHRGTPNWNYFIGAIQQARDDRLAALSPPNPSKGNPNARKSQNTIAGNLAVVDAAIADERRRIEALERKSGAAGNGETERGPGAKLLS